jgi:hypothetical protein
LKKLKANLTIPFHFSSLNTAMQPAIAAKITKLIVKTSIILLVRMKRLALSSIKGLIIGN